MQDESYADDRRGRGKRKAGALVRTGTPGIFKKIGARKRPYVVVYRAAGKQRKEACRTLAEARAVKAARAADDARGEFQARSKTTLRDYLSEWIETYAGNGRRGFRENTRKGIGGCSTSTRIATSASGCGSRI